MDQRFERAVGDHVDVDDPEALSRWTVEFGVAPEKIREAVAQVGNQVDKVREYLVGQQGAGYG